VNSTEQHAELIAAGWRLSINGYWISPHPTDSRVAIKSLSAAWQAHTAHTQTDQYRSPGG
jgi:hypothetical protein